MAKMKQYIEVFSKEKQKTESDLETTDATKASGSGILTIRSSNSPAGLSWWRLIRRIVSGYRDGTERLENQDVEMFEKH